MTFINLGLNHTLSECLIILYFVNSPTPLTQFFFLVNKTPTAVNMLHMRKYYKENDVSYAFVKTTGIWYPNHGWYRTVSVLTYSIQQLSVSVLRKHLYLMHLIVFLKVKLQKRTNPSGSLLSSHIIKKLTWLWIWHGMG